PPTPATYPLSLHDALPISMRSGDGPYAARITDWIARNAPLRRHVLDRLRREGPLPLSAFEDRSVHSWTSSGWNADRNVSQMLARSEEHTSELQSPYDLVCR